MVQSRIVSQTARYCSKLAKFIIQRLVSNAMRDASDLGDISRLRDLGARRRKLHRRGLSPGRKHILADSEGDRTRRSIMFYFKCVAKSLRFHVMGAFSA